MLHACTWLVLASARFPSAFSSTMATSRSCRTTTSTAKTYRRQSPKQKMHRIPSRRPRKRASTPELPTERWLVLFFAKRGFVFP